MALPENIVEARIEQLAAALSSDLLTVVELVAKCLVRISTYDCRGTALNSIPLINEDVFEEAAAADDRRTRGQAVGPLDGIPFTVKDSYKVNGMTVASGSEAFKELTANEDAFLVATLRRAGAILIGKTNMCPMAYGGMLRGAYGRAESPYNKDYLAAAFGSGSSNGSGASTAASFASFGLGGETVSSGRSPASNNALVCYTPSKGLISVRGSWPLYPTCDVAIPHTRTLDDLLILLDTITTKDRTTTSDFWRDQPFVPVPDPFSKLHKSFTSICDRDHLKGKRIAVPQMYITPSDDPFVSKSVEAVWRQAKADLEAAGATVEIVNDFPAVQAYEQLQHAAHATTTLPHLPDNWNATERGALIAHGWEDFLASCSSTHSLATASPAELFPQLPWADPQLKFTEPANMVQWTKLSSYIADRPATSTKYPGKSPIYDVPELENAVRALEQMRKHYFEDWLTARAYDYVAFPAVGDVGRANADIDESSAEHAWKNGVKYSHGNRAIRHLGIPGVTVPMGMLSPQNMPIGLTILGRAYEDVDILSAAYAYEQASKRRVAPPLTPLLKSDLISAEARKLSGSRPEFSVTRCVARSSPRGDTLTVEIEGLVKATDKDEFKPQLDIFIDGKAVEQSDIKIEPSQQQDVARFSCQHSTAVPPVQDERNAVVGQVARDSTMVMALARGHVHGRPSGYLKLIHASNVLR